MSRRTQIIFGLLGIILVAGIAYVASMQMGLGDIAGDAPAADSEDSDTDLADMTPGERLCSLQTTVDDIRRRIFERARATTDGDAAAISRLETGTIARIEEPRLIDYDDGLERAECEGRLILELPRGTEPAFNYNRRLTANLTYVAEPGINGQGRAARMSGADGLIDRLAGADLVGRRDEPDFDDFDEFEDEDGSGEKPEDLLPEPGFDTPNRPARPPRDSGEEPEDILPPAMQEDSERP